MATPHYTDIYASKPIHIVASGHYVDIWTAATMYRHVSELLVETSQGYILKSYLIPPNLSN